jgi:hypothetical protein
MGGSFSCAKRALHKKHCLPPSLPPSLCPFLSPLYLSLCLSLSQSSKTIRRCSSGKKAKKKERVLQKGFYKRVWSLELRGLGVRVGVKERVLQKGFKRVHVSAR